MKYPFLGLWLLCCALPIAAAGGARGETCGDPCLKATIALQFIRSPFLSPFRIDIRVTDSVATLEGAVSDAAERALAEEIAAGLNGISGVVNHIRVDPALAAQRPTGAPVDCQADDAALAGRVESQLYWNRTTHGMAVDISARDGEVTLRGEAADRHQAEMARLIALNTCGVKRVDSELRTRPPP